jgi:hypothetical protein
MKFVEVDLFGVHVVARPVEIGMSANLEGGWGS